MTWTASAGRLPTFFAKLGRKNIATSRRRRSVGARLPQGPFRDRSAKATEFRQAISDAIVRDCLVRVTWTGDADIDILIEEPSGTVCSLRNQRTTAGGVLLGDSFAHNGSESENVTSETYVCPKAFTGRYRMLVRRIWGDVTAGKVTVDIYTNRHTENEKHVRKQIPLTDKDSMVVFAVDEGRRKESLTEHQVASVAKAQATINRTILAQHLNSLSDSDAVASLAVARNRGIDPRLAFRRNPAVGYRPEITTLPEGTILTGATAVISADRRFVRFTPGLISFNTIGDVQTFNFVSGNTGNGNGGIGGVGGGVGGVGGAGGGGFGGGFGGFGGGF